MTVYVGGVVADDRELSTQEAAQRLAVKPETVYAYVSRGLLTSRRGRGGRTSMFSAAEVDRLATRSGPRYRAPGVVETVATRLTLLEHDELYFRGYRAAELAGSRSLESVAALLWHGELNDTFTFTSSAPAVERTRTVLMALPGGARLTDQLRVAVAALATSDPWRYDLSTEAVTRCGASLIRSLVESITPPFTDGSSKPGEATLAQLLWPLLTDQPPHREVLNAAMVLLADHGLAVSTLTARVAASARAHPYAVITAGLGALDGPFHGTASTAALRLLHDASADPVAAITERLRTGEHIPGFGHTIYLRRDPRAEVLLDLVRDTPASAVVADLTAHLADRAGLFPNVDLALAAIMHAHQMRPDAAELIFALARIVGWIAHALEEYTEPGLRFRSSGAYVGLRPRSLPAASTSGSGTPR